MGRFVQLLPPDTRCQMKKPQAAEAYHGGSWKGPEGVKVKSYGVL